MAETIPVWAQWAQWAFAVGVPTLILAAAAGWIKLNRRLDRIDHSIEQLRVQGNGHLSLTGSLVNALNRNNVVSADEFSAIIRNFVELGGVATVPNNPISPEEHQRLNEYVGLAKQGGPFTPDQVEDYRAIVAKLEAEKPNDTDVWKLVALGALLLGLYPLVKKE